MSDESTVGKSGRAYVGAKRGPKNKGLTTELTIRVSPQLLADARREAAAVGLALAEWVRMRIESGLNTRR